MRRFIAAIALLLTCCNAMAKAEPNLMALPEYKKTIDFNQHDLLLHIEYTDDGLELLRLAEEGEIRDYSLRLDFYIGPYVKSAPVSVYVPVGDMTSTHVLPMWKKRIRIEKEALDYLASTENWDYLGPEGAKPLDITLRLYLVAERRHMFEIFDEVSTVSTVKISGLEVEGRSLPPYSKILGGYAKPIIRSEYKPLIPSGTAVVSVGDLLKD